MDKAKIIKRSEEVEKLNISQQVIVAGYAQLLIIMNSMTLEQLKELFPILKGAWFYGKFNISWK